MMEPTRLYELFVNELDLRTCLLNNCDLPPFPGSKSSSFWQLHRIIDAAVQVSRGNVEAAEAMLDELPSATQALLCARLVRLYLLSEKNTYNAYKGVSDLIDDLSLRRINRIRHRLNPMIAADHVLASRWAPALRLYLLSYFSDYETEQLEWAQQDIKACQEAGLDSDLVEWLHFSYLFARARQQHSLPKLISTLAEWKAFSSRCPIYGFGIEYFLEAVIALEYAGRFEESLHYLEEILTAEPNNFESLLIKARIEKRIGRIEECLQTCGIICSTWPQEFAGFCLRSNTSLLQGELTNALADAEHACILAPENSNVYMARAFVYLQDGDFEAALADFEQALEIDPERQDALRGKGKCLGLIGRDFEALACYNQLRRLNPDDPDLLYELADTQYAAGYLGECEKTCKTCLRLDPEFVSAYVLLGMVALRKNDDDQARRLLKRAVALEPDNPIALNELSYLTHLEGDDDTAIELVDRAIEESPEFADALCNKGTIQYFRSEFDAAIQNFESTIALAPDYVAAWVGKGNTLTQLCEFEEAGECFDQALALDPGNIDACYGKAMLYRMIGLEDEAREWQERAFELEHEQEGG